MGGSWWRYTGMSRRKVITYEQNENGIDELYSVNDNLLKPHLYQLNNTNEKETGDLKIICPRDYNA